MKGLYLVVTHGNMNVPALSVCFQFNLGRVRREGADSLASTAFYLY